MRKCVKCKIQKHRISQCLWTKNRGKVTAFRDAELVFSPLSLSYKLSLFLLIADFKWGRVECRWEMREGAANWLITLTAAKVELFVQKDFQENFSPLENLELVMLDPAISCLDRLGKPCYHFPRTRCGRLGRDCLCGNETRMRKQIQKTVTMRTIQILYIV